VRALCAEHPELIVLTEAARIEEVPHGSVIVLATRVEDASWLNMARPIFAERALKVVLWSKTETTGELARRAPDFFDWIARRVECPGGPPAFAVTGLRAALRARAWAVAWKGRGLDEAFAVAFPKRALVRANAAMTDDVLFATVKGAGAAWIVWSNVLDERGGLRVRRIVSRAGRRGRNILDNPQRVRGRAAGGIAGSGARSHHPGEGADSCRCCHGRDRKGRPRSCGSRRHDGEDGRR